ncbi:ABC-type maltose transport system permease subunit [Streptomyces sp. LBL]|nr:ABC-type maltose transport system permease subunit [Streptomyces sp. LBL]
MIISATTGPAVSRMRLPGYRKHTWVFPVIQMFPVAVLMEPMYQILSDPQLIDS